MYAHVLLPFESRNDDGYVDASPCRYSNHEYTSGRVLQTWMRSCRLSNIAHIRRSTTGERRWAVIAHVFIQSQAWHIKMLFRAFAPVGNQWLNAILCITSNCKYRIWRLAIYEATPVSSYMPLLLSRHSRSLCICKKKNQRDRNHWRFHKKNGDPHLHDHFPPMICRGTPVRTYSSHM